MPITITSRFKPLTYDEITKPLIEQTQAQHALEDAYIAAQDQAAQIMAQANEQTDPQSYARLKNYANAIQQQADVLMRQGLNRNSRQSLLNLHRRYGQDIIPIQLAATRRSELAEEQRKMQLQHPDMLFERDASTLSLDDLVRNPQMNYGQTVMGSDISKRASALATAFSKGRQSIALGQNLDKYTQTILSQSGLTADEIQAALNGNADEADKVLEKALAGLYSSTGVDNWGSQSAKDAVRGYIQEGAMQGIGQYDIKTQRDENAMRQEREAERWAQLNLQANLYGKSWNAEKKKWMDDPELTNVKTKYSLNENGTVDGATDANMVAGPKSSKYGGIIYRTQDGVYCLKTGKDSYVPIGNQEDAANEFNVGNSQKQFGKRQILANPIMFKGDNATQGSIGEFNPDGASEVSWSKLTAKQRAYITGKLAMWGLDEEDVVIYMDKDWGRNDYIVMPKGYDSYGNKNEEKLEF